MTTPLLPDREWQISYGPSDDRLNDFYIPALQASVRHDRSAGFFSSSALAVAAAGVAGLIHNGGTMRLLAGAQMDQADVDAIVRGEALESIVAGKLMAALEQPAEEVLQRRLEVLAWMVAQGTLEIRVVLPCDKQRRPVANSQDYYHPKEGIFTDLDGNQMAFNGSVNESITAWQRNYEQFNVYFSWEPGVRPYLQQSVRRFENLWEDREPNWIGMAVPDAVRQALIRYAPSSAPEVDPLAAPPPEAEARSAREGALLAFLRDAPYFPHADGLGEATCAIQPWPHQVNVSRRVITTYPHPYLLCDEVGLGKTIEAGLVIRQLVLSGRIKRCLLLVPRSVARQWQEELYEKFVLDVPRFEGKRFWSYSGEELPYSGNPWDAFDVMIASSQLAKRRDRQPDVLAARPWDVVLVDEAHHARRKDFLQPQYRPNRLLELLLRLRRTSLVMMTATPMQVHPLEVWDLLSLLGLPGEWRKPDNFIAFYDSLMQTPDEADWDFLFGMVQDYLTHGGLIDKELEQRGRAELGLVRWETVAGLPGDHTPSQTVHGLTEKGQEYAYELARRHTPLRTYMLRNTRELLREYRRRGLLSESVPTRQPRLEWITMRDEEMHLYLRIEEYISRFYKKYEAKRKGLGFVMTVYRRRLTSSFYAVRQSLERRLDFLKGLAPVEQIVDDDDLEQDELAEDIEETLPAEGYDFYLDEIEYVEDFLAELRQLSVHDSKTEQLIHDLNNLFFKRDTVLIFTQYSDTMDYLRDKLREVYGDQVACYSGRGGERWNGTEWVIVTKEDIKREFRKGEDVKILVCTEAASEGLNLQTCGILINYDMPWNPMRVEQRIGRIDRIGQRYETVWIRNYFYEDTIEARVYLALSTRIQWFVGIVGQLQPILAQVGQAIQRLAMAPPDQQQQLFDEAITQITERLDRQQEQDAMGVYQQQGSAEMVSSAGIPVTLAEMEDFLTTSQHFSACFHPHPDWDRAYLLDSGSGPVAVTFDRMVFDEHPNSVQFLSYGNPLLETLLADAGAQPDAFLRLDGDEPIPYVAYYGAGVDGQPHLVETFREALEMLSAGGGSVRWTGEMRAAADRDVRSRVGHDS